MKKEATLSWQQIHLTELMSSSETVKLWIYGTAYYCYFYDFYLSITIIFKFF